MICDKRGDTSLFCRTPMRRPVLRAWSVCYAQDANPDNSPTRNNTIYSMYRERSLLCTHNTIISSLGRITRLLSVHSDWVWITHVKFTFIITYNEVLVTLQLIEPSLSFMMTKTTENPKECQASMRNNKVLIEISRTNWSPFLIDLEAVHVTPRVFEYSFLNAT